MPVCDNNRCDLKKRQKDQNKIQPAVSSEIAKLCSGIKYAHVGSGCHLCNLIHGWGQPKWVTDILSRLIGQWNNASKAFELLQMLFFCLLLLLQLSTHFVYQR